MSRHGSTQVLATSKSQTLSSATALSNAPAKANSSSKSSLAKSTPALSQPLRRNSVPQKLAFAAATRPFCIKHTTAVPQTVDYSFLTPAQRARFFRLSKPFAFLKDEQLDVETDRILSRYRKQDKTAESARPATATTLTATTAAPKYEIILRNIRQFDVDANTLPIDELHALIKHEIGKALPHSSTSEIDPCALLHTTSNCFDQVIAHFHTLAPLLAEIKTQYAATARFLELQLAELRYLRGKTQRLLCENGNEFVMSSARDRNHLLRCRIDALEKECADVIDQMQDEEARFLQKIGEEYVAKFPQLSDEEKKDPKWRSKWAYVADYVRQIGERHAMFRLLYEDMLRDMTKYKLILEETEVIDFELGDFSLIAKSDQIKHLIETKRLIKQNTKVVKSVAEDITATRKNIDEMDDKIAQMSRDIEMLRKRKEFEEKHMV